MTDDTTPPSTVTISPRVRTAWLAVGSIAAVGMLAFGTLSAVGLLAREDRVIRHEFDPDDIDVVDVYSDNGNVTVYGDAESSIQVVVNVREGVAGIDETARTDGRQLVLSAECPGFWATFCDADYEVHVPPGMRVVARSDNGDVRVSGIDGGAHATSSNGDVVADRLGGRVTLTTSNGNVQATALDTGEVDGESSNGDVTIDFDRAPQRVRAESDNGDVEVRLPRGDELYAVDATTDNGDASTPVRTDPDGRRRIVARSDNGDVSVRYR